MGDAGEDSEAVSAPQTDEQPQSQGGGVMSAIVGNDQQEMVKGGGAYTDQVELVKQLGFKGLVRAYFKKFAGKKDQRPPRYTLSLKYHNNINILIVIILNIKTISTNL